jgi:D-alanyl-D-alanine carboxypeptidase
MMSLKNNLGDILSLFDVLHGMMLPSGNDAAYCVAETLG